MDRARNAWTIRRRQAQRGASKRSSNERNLWLKPISSPARTGHREGTTKIYSRLLQPRELSGASLVFVVVLLKSSSFRRPGVKCFSPLFWDDDDDATNDDCCSSKDDDCRAIVDDLITITIVSLLLLLLMMMMMSLRTCWRSRESNNIRKLCVKQLWITNAIFIMEGCGMRGEIRL